LSAAPPEEIFTPEDFTDEHRAIAKTTDEFWQRKSARTSTPSSTRNTRVREGLLRKSGELGLTAVVIPENSAAWKWT
jgi:alkylation response protein AidB-like acyl-CoA dehydrogenase